MMRTTAHRTWFATAYVLAAAGRVTGAQDRGHGVELRLLLRLQLLLLLLDAFSRPRCHSAIGQLSAL